MKRKHLIAAIAALGAGSAVVAVTASGRPATASRARTIRLVERKTSFKLVDTAPKGESTGDTGVLAGELLSAGSSRKVGSFEGVCVLVKPAVGNSECTFTLSLAGGQLTTHAGYGKGFNGDKVVHEAVLGGTRAFRGARGEVVSRETGETTERLTVRLGG